MRNGQFVKRLKYRVRLTKPKIMRFAPERNQPHAQTRVELIEVCPHVPKCQRCENKEVRQQIVGCTCNGCMEYLRRLSIVAPMRFKELTQPTEIKGFIRRKALPEHVHVRRRLAYALLKQK